MSPQEIESGFRQAMVDSGIYTSTRIPPDGRLRRFHVEGDQKGSKNGWAVLYRNSAAGAFGSWKDRPKETWSAKGARGLTRAERRRMAKQIQEERERHEQELAESRAGGAKWALEQWESAPPAEPTHPYLRRKGVEPHGLRQDGSLLLVPVRDAEDYLHGLQQISEHGEKKFTYETWKKGHFYLIGDVPTERLYVTEGYATGATVHAATGDPVAVAFDCDNLLSVAEALRSKFPDVEIVIAGDNDHAGSEGNIGRTSAYDAARAVNGSAAIPDLSGDEGTDWNDFAALHGLNVVRKKLAHAEYPSPDGWPESPDLPGSPDPDPLPLDALPSVLQDHARSVAASIQVPKDLTGLLCLLCASAAVAGKYEIRVDDSWRSEWSPLFGIVILPSGERKSPSFAEMIRPIQEWESERCAELRPIHQAALDAVEVGEKELKRAKEPKKDGHPIDLNEVEASRLALDKAKAKVPVLPRLLVGDATPEALVRRMADNQGRAALLSPEGDPLRIADGRHSDGAARLDEWKKAWSGEPIAPDRIGRDAKHVLRPALTVGLTIQPSVLHTLRNARSMRGEGLFARFLFVRPLSLVGTRSNSGAAPPFDIPAALRYRAAIRVLLDAEPAGYEDDGTPIPHALHIEDEALQVLYAYMDELEVEKRDGKRLAGICDWAEKAHGQVVRVAALLELSERAATGQELFTGPISVTAMDSAIRLVRALTTHALAVFWEMSANPQQALLAYVLKKACGLPDGSTLRDLHIATRGKESINTVEDVRELVAKLGGCIRLRVRPSTGGQPPSPILEINPNILDTHTQKTHKSRLSGQDWTSVTSVRVKTDENRSDEDPSPIDEERDNEDDIEYLQDERAGMQAKEPDDAPAQERGDEDSPPLGFDLWPGGDPDDDDLVGFDL